MKGKEDGKDERMKRKDGKEGRIGGQKKSDLNLETRSSQKQ